MASTNTLIKNLLNVKNTVVESAKNYVGLSNILDSDLGGRHPAERPHG